MLFIINQALFLIITVISALTAFSARICIVRMQQEAYEFLDSEFFAAFQKTDLFKKMLADDEFHPDTCAVEAKPDMHPQQVFERKR